MWISVKDRLPEYGVEVLVATQSGMLVEAHAKEYGSPFGCGWNADNLSAWATHWMPLPEPPK